MLRGNDGSETADDVIKIPLTADGKTDVAKALKVAQHNFDELEYDVVLPYVENRLKTG